MLQWFKIQSNNNLKLYRSRCRRYQVASSDGEAWIAYIDLGMWEPLGDAFKTKQDAMRACQQDAIQSSFDTDGSPLSWQSFVGSSEYRIWRSVCGNYQVARPIRDYNAEWTAMIDDGDWSTLGTYDELLDAMKACEKHAMEHSGIDSCPEL